MTRDIFVECFILFSTCAIHFSSLRIIRASSAGGVARRARFKKGENSVNSCACGKLAMVKTMVKRFVHS